MNGLENAILAAANQAHEQAQQRITPTPALDQRLRMQQLAKENLRLTAALENAHKDAELWKFRAVENGKTVKRQKAELLRKAEEHNTNHDGK